MPMTPEQQEAKITELEKKIAELEARPKAVAADESKIAAAGATARQVEKLREELEAVKKLVPAPAPAPAAPKAPEPTVYRGVLKERK